MALTLAACAPTREDPPEDAGTPEAAEPADIGAPERAGGTDPDKQEAAEPGAGADVSRRDPGDRGDSRNP